MVTSDGYNLLTCRSQFSTWAIKVLKNVVQSMSLAIGYGITFSSIMCFLRNIRHKDGELNPFLSGAAAGLWIACESPTRRLELTRIAFKDVDRSFVLTNFVRLYSFVIIGFTRRTSFLVYPMEKLCCFASPLHFCSICIKTRGILYMDSFKQY